MDWALRKLASKHEDKTRIGFYEMASRDICQERWKMEMSGGGGG